MTAIWSWLDTTADKADANVFIACGIFFALSVAALIHLARRDARAERRANRLDLDRALICGPRNPVDTGVDEYQEAFDKHTADALAAVDGFDWVAAERDMARRSA